MSAFDGNFHLEAKRCDTFFGSRRFLRSCFGSPHTVGSYHHNLARLTMPKLADAAEAPLLTNFCQ